MEKSTQIVKRREKEKKQGKIERNGKEIYRIQSNKCNSAKMIQKVTLEEDRDVANGRKIYYIHYRKKRQREVGIERDRCIETQRDRDKEKQRQKEIEIDRQGCRDMEIK